MICFSFEVMNIMNRKGDIGNEKVDKIFFGKFVYELFVVSNLFVGYGSVYFIVIFF